jgi:hypothetical protein
MRTKALDVLIQAQIAYLRDNGWVRSQQQVKGLPEERGQKWICPRTNETFAFEAAVNCQKFYDGWAKHKPGRGLVPAPISTL